MRLMFWCLLLQFFSMNISSGYDDISANKPTRHGENDKNSDVSENAVDRSMSTCSSAEGNNDKPSSWWYVDLETVKSIYDVEIFFRLYDTTFEQRQRERMYGYRLYISNSTDFDHLQEAYLCYNHTGSALPDLNVTHICVSFGRYVIFYNERVPGVKYQGNEKNTYTQLCEVIVQGCEKGDVYGNLCDKKCPSNCQGRRCYITNGTCAGCVDGWIGNKCHDACQYGYYGAECKNTCAGHCRHNNSCNHITGHCDEGCLSGWMGYVCNETCINGTYGENCAKNCSEHCVIQQGCNKESGNCDGGCTPGYIGSKCEQECNFGTYGANCTKVCSGNCYENKTCLKLNGICMNGCRAGFKGALCNESCGFGYYGENCSQLCSVNCLDACDKVNGLCKCKKGRMGRNCSERCSSGYYGHNCKEKCSLNCLKNESCSVVNGTCPSGCEQYYEGDKCEQWKDSAVKSSSSTPEINKEYIIYGIVSGVVLIILIAVVMFIWRRNAKPVRKEHDGSQQSLEFVVHDSKENRKMNVDVDGFHSFKNEVVQRHEETISPNANQRRIKIEDLCTRIKNMSDQENAGFKKEYMAIPNGELHSCEVAKREENKTKNRYTTIFPYDHTRVTLHETTCNKDAGYINANYITDLSGEKGYIATQGPKKKTIVDFWEMLWQESVTTIVCLTKLKEGAKEKCRHYWPNNGEKIEHGHFAIRNNEEKAYANYVKRNLHIQNIVKKEERDVLMFHYTQWPDHGVPEAINLVVFHRHIMRSDIRNPLQHKVVVHCSAGIGRTGTFIALDALYRDSLRTGSVNVLEYVTQMRHDRMNMIQGEDQYKMVYTALYESFRGDLRPVDPETFLSQYQTCSCYENLGEVANKKSVVVDHFEELQSLTPRNTANNTKYGHTNLADNFTQEDIPAEKYGCYVLSDDDRPVQYNAVILQSFTKPDGIISAQYATENQCEDFLYLLRESGAGTVVFLGQLSDISSTKVWFPSKNDTKVVGGFRVKIRNCTPSACVTKTNISIQKKGYKDVHVSVLECNFWRGNTMITDCRKVLNVIAETRLEETNHPNTRTLVLSSDDEKRSGPFCVAYNAIEQLILDKEVDIFTTTRLIQIRRPDFISTIEEYQFCHDLVAEYIQNDTVYANYTY